MEISQPLAELDWIPRPRLLALRRLGIETAEDLLTHFPRRHEDRYQFPHFPREERDAPICLCGEVVKTSIRRFGGWKKIFEATLEESSPNALSEPLVCRCLPAASAPCRRAGNPVAVGSEPWFGSGQRVQSIFRRPIFSTTFMSNCVTISSRVVR